MKKIITALVIINCSICLSQNSNNYDKYFYTQEYETIIFNNDIGSDFELGSGIDLTIPYDPKGAPILGLNISNRDHTELNKQPVNNKKLGQGFSMQIFEANSSQELAKRLYVNFKASYGLASFSAATQTASKFHSSSSSVFVIIENVEQGPSISQDSLNWKTTPRSEIVQCLDGENCDEKKLTQFIGDYGSHYITSLSYGYRISIHGKINSQSEERVKKFKAAIKASFTGGGAGGSVSSSQSSLLKSDDVEIRAEIRSGGISYKGVQDSKYYLLTGFDEIRDFLKKIKNDKITIYSAPVKAQVKSYRSSLLHYPESQKLFKKFIGYSTKSDFGVPQGTIIAWSPKITPNSSKELLDMIPNGWTICDGQNGAPDLTDKFVMGTSDVNQINFSGGKEVHTHLTEGASIIRKYRVDEGNSSLTTSGHHHKVVEAENLPPFLKLIYIMKL